MLLRADQRSLVSDRRPVFFLQLLLCRRLVDSSRSPAGCAEHVQRLAQRLVGSRLHQAAVTMSCIVSAAAIVLAINIPELLREIVPADGNTACASRF